MDPTMLLLYHEDSMTQPTPLQCLLNLMIKFLSSVRCGRVWTFNACTLKITRPLDACIPVTSVVPGAGGGGGDWWWRWFQLIDRQLSWETTETACRPPCCRDKRHQMMLHCSSRTVQCSPHKPPLSLVMGTCCYWTFDALSIRLIKWTHLAVAIAARCNPSDVRKISLYLWRETSGQSNLAKAASNPLPRIHPRQDVDLFSRFWTCQSVRATDRLTDAGIIDRNSRHLMYSNLMRPNIDEWFRPPRPELSPNLSTFYTSLTSLPEWKAEKHRRNYKNESGEWAVS